MAIGINFTTVKRENENKGSGGGVLVVHEDKNGTLDKTWQEIANAIASTGAALVNENEGTISAASVIKSAYANAGTYGIDVDLDSYVTISASGYPSLDSGPTSGGDGDSTIIK